MSDPQKNVRVALAETKEKLAVLEELDLLDGEFKLIEHEYNQRRATLEKHLAAIIQCTQ